MGEKMREEWYSIHKHIHDYPYLNDNSCKCINYACSVPSSLLMCNVGDCDIAVTRPRSNRSECSTLQVGMSALVFLQLHRYMDMRCINI